MKKLLEELKACKPAKEWAEGKTWTEIYNTCDRGDWLLWLFKRTNPDDLQLLTLAKGHCAATVEHLMTDQRSKDAVKAAIAFGERRITKEELNAAADAADAAASYAASYAAYSAYSAAYAAAADAADAAADAADAAADAARIQNLKLTADICRKYLPIEVWNIKPDAQ